MLFGEALTWILGVSKGGFNFFSFQNQNLGLVEEVVSSMYKQNI